MKLKLNLFVLTACILVLGAITPISFNEQFSFAQTTNSTGSGSTNSTGFNSTLTNATSLDTIPPLIITPTNMTLKAPVNESQTIIQYNVTAIDNQDGIINATCIPSSGNNFTVGTDTVNCSAVDKAGNNATQSFNIDVIATKSVPSWIKSLAGSWCGGSIDSTGFVKGVQYLVNSNTITLMQNQTNSSSNIIPVWIKNDACFWSTGQIGDDEFVTALQFLVSQGIVQVVSTTQESTSVAVTPNTTTATSGVPITFTSSVSDSANSVNVPTGIVTWSDNGAGGLFSTSSCSLISGSCTVTYTPSSATSATVTASYDGDTAHATSSGTSSLTSIG